MEPAFHALRLPLLQTAVAIKTITVALALSVILPHFLGYGDSLIGSLLSKLVP